MGGEKAQMVFRDPPYNVPIDGHVSGLGAITRLVREWHGRAYTIEVLDSGFLCDGQSYRSLSEVARAITGARWSVVATYLMTNDPSVIEDYRKCSYKDRLRILRDLENGSPFYETKAGKRLLDAVREKMVLEKLTPHDFDIQKKNRWRIQGKSFYDIFAEVEHADLYAATYGMMSESIHGSWNESMDCCLVRNEDGTFSTYPFHPPADIRYVSPTLRFTNQPFRLWLQRIDAYDENLRNLLDWVERVNTALFKKFDEKRRVVCR